MLSVSELSLTIPGPNGPLTAVSSVTFQLEPGKTVALVGESGCGKTLIAQALLRLGEHQGIGHAAGTITLDGQELFSLDEKGLLKVRGGRIGMVFQEPMTALNPVFTVGDQLCEVMRLHLPLNRGQARERALSLLRDVGLEQPEQLLGQYPDQLSGGMRQRILIAMAISAEPEYLIADEPTTALDVSVQARIVALLRRLQAERHLALLLVTHDFGLVAELADFVSVMYAGEIVESGPVAEIFDAPAHPYTRALLACRPQAGRKQKLLVIGGQVPAPGQWPTGCRFAPRCPLATAECAAGPLAANFWQRGDHLARCRFVEKQ